MLPIPRDRVAAQECVGDNTRPKPTTARPAAKVRIAVDVEAHAVPAVLSQSLIGLRAAMSLALPARRCYQSSRD